MSVRFLAFVALLWPASGCAIRTLARSDDAELARALHELESPLFSARLANLEHGLHPAARALVRGEGADERWARDALIHLPVARCVSALGYAVERARQCSLVALGDGRVAVLVLNDEEGCRGEACLEQSWVFLPRHEVPLALPQRRLSDFRSLRSMVSSERASALWLAGFRSLGEGRLAARESDQADGAPALAYQTCTPAPDERQLVCRSTRGDVLAVDPLRGAARLLVQLGIDVGELPMHALAPVRFTPEGRMVVRVAAIHHPLCGSDECELTGTVDWPRGAPARVRLSRADRAPW